jgi:hypothetical protein
LLRKSLQRLKKLIKKLWNVSIGHLKNRGCILVILRMMKSFCKRSRPNHLRTRKRFWKSFWILEKLLLQVKLSNGNWCRLVCDVSWNFLWSWSTMWIHFIHLSISIQLLPKATTKYFCKKLLQNLFKIYSPLANLQPIKKS